jgi:hypothetical protein
VIPPPRPSSSDSSSDDEAVGVRGAKKRRRIGDSQFVQLGKSLMVEWGGGVYEAVVIAEEGDKVKVHFKVRPELQG